MHPSLKSIREANELTLQYRNRQSTMLVEELIEDKLMQLLAFINRLKETSLGTAEIRGRITLFGECERIEGETSGVFYGRLRLWLDRDIPQTKTIRTISTPTGDQFEGAHPPGL